MHKDKTRYLSNQSYQNEKKKLLFKTHLRNEKFRLNVKGVSIAGRDAALFPYRTSEGSFLQIIRLGQNMKMLFD